MAGKNEETITTLKLQTVKKSCQTFKRCWDTRTTKHGTENDNLKKYSK